MRFSDILASALASLRRRPLRTFLTSTGVVIGTMAVVVMVSLGVGLTQYTEMSANRASVRQVVVQSPPPPEPGRPAPKMNDELSRTLSTFHGVQTVMPVYSVQVKLKTGGVDSYMELRGLDSDAFDQLEYGLAWGHAPEPGGTLQLLAGGKAGEVWDPRTGEPKEVELKGKALFLTVDEDSLGGAVAMGAPVNPGPGGGEDGNGGSGVTASPPPVRPMIATVAGQIDEPPQVWSENSQTLMADINSLVASLKKSLPGRKLPGQETLNVKPGHNFIYNSFIVMAKDPDAALDLTKELRDAGYGAFSEAEWILEGKKAAAQAQAVLGGIGAISMLVAAIGIANTMLMSVYERQRDIGVMKVIGASMKDIGRLFLVESASIGFFGGTVGVGLSYVMSAIINQVTAQPGQTFGVSSIPPGLALAAIVGATLVAMVSGMIPARRAMNLSPLAAMTVQR